MSQPQRAGYSSIADATRLVDQFATETQTTVSDSRSSRVVAATGVWPGVNKSDLANGLRSRIRDPNDIHQKQSPLCGPSAFFRALAWDDPVAYAQAAIDLYYTGVAAVYGLAIGPSAKLRTASPDMGLQAADWVTLAGLRDSENLFFSPADAHHRFRAFGQEYDTNDAHGPTPPGDLCRWMKAAGYNDIKSDTYLTTLSKPNVTGLTNAAVRAGELFDAGYWVFLFINSQMLYAASQGNGSVLPSHWVVMTNSLRLSHGRPADPVTAKVYTWGGEQTVPEVLSQPLGQSAFLGNFYGYVAAKWVP